MSVKYLKLEIDVHGIEIDDENATLFLKGWLREATKACLIGKLAEMFRFRNSFESDIKVEIVEHAGNYSIKVDPDAL